MSSRRGSRSVKFKKPTGKSGVRLLSFDLDVGDRVKRFRSKDLQNVFKGKEREVWPRVVERQAKRWEKNFEKQGAEYGNRWEESLRAMGRYRGGPTLQDTGNMFEVFKKQVRTPDDFGENVVSWSLKSIPWQDAWLAHHQHGYIISWNNAEVPARPMIQLDAKDERYTSEVLRRWGKQRLEEALNA